MPDPIFRTPIPRYKKCNLCKAFKTTGFQEDGSLNIATQEFFIDPRTKRPRYLCKKCHQFKNNLREMGGLFCVDCKLPKKIYSNKCCKNCNELKGLRECHKCKHVLPIYLDFYTSKQTNCKSCYKCIRDAKAKRTKALAKAERAALKAALLAEKLGF